MDDFYQLWVSSNPPWECNCFYRGYGESDHPKGREQYKLSYLVNDIKEMVCWNLYSKCKDWNTTALMTYYEMQTDEKGIGNPTMII